MVIVVNTEKLLENKGLLLALIITIILLLFLTGYKVIQVYLPEPTIMKAISSPSGDYIAYVYESNGGATTGFIYHLSILEKGKKLNKGRGNTYSSGFDFDIEWLDDNVLQVNNTSSIKIYKQKEMVNGIQVKYKY